MIHFTIVSPDDSDLFFHDWINNFGLNYDGKILFSADPDKPPLSVLNFERAYCVYIHEYFGAWNKVDTQMLTQITVSALKITFGRDEGEKNVVPLVWGTSDEQAYSNELDKPALTEDIPDKANDAEGQSKGEDIGNNKVGLLGESAIATKLKAEGYEVLQIQNNSGHGIDIIAKDADGNVKCIEVKTNSSSLSKAQQQGGKAFVNDRLNKAIEGEGHYKIPPNSEQMEIDAQTAREWINDADKVEYEIHKVDVDRITGEVSNQRISEWSAKNKTNFGKAFL